MSFTNTRDVIGDQATLDGLVAHTLSELYEDGVNTIGSAAFYCNTGLVDVEMPLVASVGRSAFAGCTALETAAFPNLKYCASSAFRNCSNLTTAIFPMLSFAGNEAFLNCLQLSSVQFSSSYINISQSTFRYCINLSSISFPNVTSVGTEAFYHCMSLGNVSFPRAQTVAQYAFADTFIAKLELPAVSTLGASCITPNTAEVDIGGRVVIGTNTFSNAFNLLSLILSSQSMCTLQNIQGFSGTPIAHGVGHIFVPENLVDTYRAGTNWATYASQIVPINEYPKEIVTGTITDSWAEILAAEDDGTYTSKYSVGDTKVVDIGGFPIIMQIVAMDTDELSDGSGNAKITWLSLHVPFGVLPIQPDGFTRAWDGCYFRKWLSRVVYKRIESTVKNAIKTVKKTHSGSRINNDSVWIPSYRELTGLSTYESSGCTYASFFANDAQRIKNAGIMGTGGPASWVLRQHVSSSFEAWLIVSTNGAIGAGGITYGALAFGFCT